MSTKTKMALLVAAIAAVYVVVRAGSLEPPGQPNPTMVTLQDIGTKVNQLVPQRYRFVGVTTQTFNGAGGWAAMTNACYSQFPNARVATSTEYRATLNPPTVTSNAWIVASPRFMIRDASSYDGALFMDDTGSILQTRVQYRTIDCLSWTIANNQSEDGSILTTSGGLALTTCAAQLPVACAAPE